MCAYTLQYFAKNNVVELLTAEFLDIVELYLHLPSVTKTFMNRS